jgi:hypothetical protein
MLTLSVLWVALAAAVIMIAMRKQSAVNAGANISTRSKELGKGTAIIALVSSIALIAGFAMIGKFLVTGL